MKTLMVSLVDALPVAVGAEFCKAYLEGLLSLACLSKSSFVVASLITHVCFITSSGTNWSRAALALLLAEADDMAFLWVLKRWA